MGFFLLFSFWGTCKVDTLRSNLWHSTRAFPCLFYHCSLLFFRNLIKFSSSWMKKRKWVGQIDCIACWFDCEKTICAPFVLVFLIKKKKREMSETNSSSYFITTWILIYDSSEVILLWIGDQSWCSLHLLAELYLNSKLYMEIWFTDSEVKFRIKQNIFYWWKTKE
jgi:hypothetical protein